MTHFEEIEVAGQIDMFEYLDATRIIKPTRVKKFMVGDVVSVRFYTDEIDYIKEYNPELLLNGTITNKILDFYVISIGELELEVAGEKLKLVRRLK